MTKELDELKLRMQSDKNHLPIDNSFNEYSKIYIHSNENLKEYIKGLDGKRVLCVGSSGDHLLNSMVAGSTEIDTFDINRYARLFIELRLTALRYLDDESALIFLKEIDKELYLRINKYLPQDVKEFFDYLILTYSKKVIYDKMIQDSTVYLDNNNYESIEAIRRMKEALDRLKHTHYSCNMYSLPEYISEPYDVIYLSNIISYDHNYDRIFKFLRELRKDFLRDHGEVIYNYLWTTNPNAEKRSLFNRFGGFKITDYTIEQYSDVYDDTKVVRIKSLYDRTPDEDGIIFTDSLLKIKKER